MRKYTFIVVALFCLLSCGKDSEIFIPNEDTGDVDNLLSKINDRTESFVFNADTETEVVAASGAVVKIHPNSFTYADGSPASGSVKIRLTDITSSGMSVLNMSSTRVNAAIFGGYKMINVESFDSNDRRLYLLPGKYIEIKHPVSMAQTPSGVNLFYRGIETDERNWTEITDPINANQLKVDNWTVDSENGPIFGKGYSYIMNKLGWYCVGQYVASPSEEIEYCISLPERFNKRNTRVYFVFEELISIVTLQPASDGGDGFCEYVLNDASYPSYVVSLSADEDGNYYLGYDDDPGVSVGLKTMTPVQVTLKEIENFLLEI